VSQGGGEDGKRPDILDKYGQACGVGVRLGSEADIACKYRGLVVK